MIEALYLELRIDDSKFKDDEDKHDAKLKATRQRIVREAEIVEAEIAARFAETFKKLRDEVLGVFGILIGATTITGFLTSTTGLATSLDLISKATGESVHSLHAFDLAVQAAGGAPGEAADFMARLSTELANQRVLNTPMADWWYKFGLGAEQAKNPIEAYLKLVEKVEQANLSRPEKSAALQSLGMSPALIQETLKGSEQVKADIAKFGPYALTDRDAEVVVKMRESWGELRASVEGFARAVLGLTNDDIVGILDKLKTWVDELRQTALPWLHERAKELRDIIDHIDWGSLKDGIRTATQSIRNVIDALGGWKFATEVIIGLLVANSFAPILRGMLSLTGALGIGGPLLAAALALGAAFELYQHLKGEQTQPKHPASGVGAGDIPSRAAAPEEATTAVKGGGFAIPGSNDTSGSQKPPAASYGAPEAYGSKGVEMEVGGSPISAGHPMPVYVVNQVTAEDDDAWSLLTKFFGKAYGGVTNWWHGGSRSSVGGGGGAGPRDFSGYAGAGTAGSGHGFNYEGGRKLFGMFKLLGMSDEAAAGAVGGVMGESFTSLDPNAFHANDVRPGIGSGGLAQWNRERIQGLWRFANEADPSLGLDTSVIDNDGIRRQLMRVNADVQMRYIVWELQNTAAGRSTLARLRSTKSVGEAAAIWAQIYEGAVGGSEGRRADYGATFLKHMNDSIRAPSVFPPPDASKTKSLSGAMSALSYHRFAAAQAIHHHTEIANVSVHTQATTPEAIAQDIRVAVEREVA